MEKELRNFCVLPVQHKPDATPSDNQSYFRWNPPWCLLNQLKSISHFFDWFWLAHTRDSCSSPSLHGQTASSSRHRWMKWGEHERGQDGLQLYQSRKTTTSSLWDLGFMHHRSSVLHTGGPMWFLKVGPLLALLDSVHWLLSAYPVLMSHHHRVQFVQISCRKVAMIQWEIVHHCNRFKRTCICKRKGDTENIDSTPQREAITWRLPDQQTVKELIPSSHQSIWLRRKSLLSACISHC